MAVTWLLMWARYFVTTHYFTLATIIQDDAFYYLLPAWNCSRLGWFTFDGVTQTYGFQPLWELGLVVLARLMPSREIFFRAALVMGAVLYAATAVVMARVARATWRGVQSGGGDIAGALAAAMILLNLPVGMANSAAKENALYGLLLSCLLLVRLRPQQPTSRKGPAAAGILAGLVLLTRLTPMSVAVVVLQRLPGDRSARLRFASVYALAALLTMLPWWLFACWTFGSAVPTSGRVKLHGFWEDLFSGGSGLAGSASATVDYVVASVRFALGYSSQFWPAQTDNQNFHRLPFLVLTAAGLVWTARVKRAYLLLVTGGVLLALASMPVLMHLRIVEIYYYRWYVVELPIFVAIFAGVGAEMIVARLRRSWPPLGLAGVVALAIWIYPSMLDAAAIARPTTTYVDRGEWQQIVLRLTLSANRDMRLARHDRIGAFSAGLLGWFSEATVINLDGLGNDEIVALWEEKGSYQEYCKRRGIGLYIDAADPRESFRDFTVVRAIPMSRTSALPVYFIARLPL